MDQKKKLVRKRKPVAAVQEDEATRKEDEKKAKTYPGKYPSDHHEEITDPYHNFCKVAAHVRKLSQTGEK